MKNCSDIGSQLPPHLCVKDGKGEKHRQIFFSRILIWRLEQKSSTIDGTSDMSWHSARRSCWVLSPVNLGWCRSGLQVCLDAPIAARNKLKLTRNGHSRVFFNIEKVGGGGGGSGDGGGGGGGGKTRVHHRLGALHHGSLCFSATK